MSLPDAPPAEYHNYKALKYAITGNLVALLLNLILLRHSPGEAIRPMDLTLFLLWVGLLTPIFTIPRAILSLWKNPKVDLLSNIFALILSFTPLLLGFLGFWIMVYLMGFELKD